MRYRGGPDAEKRVDRPHDRRGDAAEYNCRKKRRRLVQQKRRRGVILGRQRGHRAGEDRRLDAEADAEEEQQRDDQHDGHQQRVPTQLAWILEHVVLADHLRLPERPQPEHQEERQRGERRQLPPGPEEPRIVGQDRPRNTGKAATAAQHGGEHQQRRDRLDAALKDIGVHAGEDPARGGVRQHDRSTDQHTRRERDGEDRLKHESEREQVGRDVADGGDQDRNGTDALRRG